MKKKINKILYSSAEFINCYNNIFRNALKKPNIKAAWHDPVNDSIKISSTIRKYDYSIYNDLYNDGLSFNVITPYAKDYGTIIDDIESAIYSHETYIACPYCIIILRLDEDILECERLIMFCMLKNK